MEPLSPIAPLVLLIFALYTVVKIIKDARGRDWNGVLTVGLAWLAGTVLSWLFAEATIGEGTVLPIGNGVTLGDLNLADYVFVGLFLASAAGVLTDGIKAFDRTRSTAQPELLSGETTMVLPANTVIVSDPPPPNQ